MTETLLRARLRNGDPPAFAEIFDQHASAVYAYAARWLGNPSMADDVVSLTFLDAWRLRDRILADGGSLRPWLLGIATNVLRNLSRAARRHRAAMSRLPPPEPVPDFADDLVGQFADVSYIAAVRAALDRLRPADREVFLLCVWSGLDYASAAEALGVPIGTVRSRLSRARQRLRTLTAAEMEPHTHRGQVADDRAIAVRSRTEQMQ